MALFAIGDLHLSFGCDKPMDIFSGWQDYTRRLEKNWRAKVQPEDTVVVAGDVSWAMDFAALQKDFAFLQALPGKKILLKGNHDYWWATMAKMQAFVSENGFDSLFFLHNNSYVAEGVSLCGTRGWLFDEGEPHDAKVMARETGRLRMSLEAAKMQQKIVFLHYPPCTLNAKAPEMIAVMQEFGVRRCYYGHLHGASIRRAVQGEVGGICYKLISADGLDFSPYRVLPESGGIPE